MRCLNVVDCFIETLTLKEVDSKHMYTLKLGPVTLLLYESWNVYYDKNSQ